jgi:uncharacterized protein (DUF736 family)
LNLPGNVTINHQPPNREAPMIIGNFSFDRRSNTYAATITTLTLHRSNIVLRLTNKSGEKEPDYRIIQEDDSGTVEFGAAWKRSSGQGRDFLSIVLDDPAFPASLNAAMFLSDREDTATLVWQRPKPIARVAEPEPRAARPSGSSSRNPRLG